jgi:predicted nucleic acid-binding protein
MRKVLFDTNVVLEVLLDRPPFADIAAVLFSKVDQGLMKGYLGATTLTTIYYLAAKTVGAKQAEEYVKQLLALFEVAPVTRDVLEVALQVGFGDFEDVVLYEAARQVGVDAIVTRNMQDFKQAQMPIYTPAELAQLL